MRNIKVVLIGSGGVGKTTIKKIFFDEEDPEELLNNPLEPTCGIDISNYNLGNMISVHDLAGQQLEDWFENEHSVFFQTDLLLLILDATSPWGENEQLWLRLYRVCKKHYSQIYFGLLFHKVDLLSLAERRALEKKIKDYSFNQLGFHPYLTSINQNYFGDTLITFISLLKAAVFPKKKQFYTDIMKLNLLEQAVKKTAIKFTEFELPDIDRESLISDYFQDMQKSGLLTVDNILQQIRITPKGRNFIEKYSSRIYSKLLQIKSEDSAPLLGFLLADKFGRQFYMFEETKDFFKKIFDQLGSDIDPAMITGFFYAAQAFGDQIDEEGVSSIEFRGQKINIMILLEEKLFGNFFFEKTVMLGTAIKEILSQFLKSLNHQFTREIDIFLQTGDMGIFDKVKDMLQSNIQELKDKIKNSVSLQSKAQKIYTDLSQNRQFDIKEKKDLKKNLFNFMLSEDENKISPLKKRFF